MFFDVYATSRPSLRRRRSLIQWHKSGRPTSMRRLRVSLKCVWDFLGGVLRMPQSWKGLHIKTQKRPPFRAVRFRGRLLLARPLRIGRSWLSLADIVKLSGFIGIWLMRFLPWFIIRSQKVHDRLTGYGSHGAFLLTAFFVVVPILGRR